MASNQEKIAAFIFGEVPTVEELNERYPRRGEYAVVTRSGPSPTGEAHIGLLYVSQICKIISKQEDENGFETDGTFFLRIEDTDKAREVPGAAKRILDLLEEFDLKPDEYPEISKTGKVTDVGYYGPYVQSERALIYKAFAKKLYMENLIYPCFCTSDELSSMREKQIAEQSPVIGYVKDNAKCRFLSNEEVLINLEKGLPYVLRYKVSTSQPTTTLEFRDGIKGDITITRNIEDRIILKSNGIPSYHFAHVVDDYLMDTRIVIRGDEWLNSLPFHLQLWSAIGVKVPKYCHIAPIEKIDEKTGERRKISKRKDPEASIQYFIDNGYPLISVKDYLLNVANSNFESFKRNHNAWKKNQLGEEPVFRLELSKCSKSGALFDFNKLNSISKNQIAVQSTEESFEQLLNYLKCFDKPFYKTVLKNEEKTKHLIELNTKRKDIINWKTFKSIYGFAYNNIFNKLKSDSIKFNKLKKSVGNRFIESDLIKSESSESFFNGLKVLATEFKFSTTNKKSETEVGTISEFVEIVRHNITKKTKSPDLFELVKILDFETIQKRMK